MKAFDESGRLVDVALTGERQIVKASGAPIEYAKLPFWEKNKVDLLADLVYDLPTFDGECVYCVRSGYICSIPAIHIY